MTPILKESMYYKISHIDTGVFNYFNDFMLSVMNPASI
jgi:hypothetical protein